MRILAGKKWKGGFLDYFRNKSGYRVRVLAWKNLEKLENVYHTRPKSLRLLLNYFPVVGPVGMFTKTWSRLREDRRNDKYIACGIGKIAEKPEGGNFREGETVGFWLLGIRRSPSGLFCPKSLFSKSANPICPNFRPRRFFTVLSIKAAVKIPGGRRRKPGASIRETKFRKKCTEAWKKDCGKK